MELQIYSIENNVLVERTVFVVKKVPASSFLFIEGVPVNIKEVNVTKHPENDSVLEEDVGIN